VIAAALSMSSSAFVLQLLAERGESASRTGSATLGILLFQVSPCRQLYGREHFNSRAGIIKTAAGFLMWGITR